MSFTIDGTEVGQVIEIASIVGSIVGTLILCLIVYLLVRPPRHVRQRRKAERRGELLRNDRDDYDAEDMRRLADRMEARLEVLELALGDQLDRPAIGRRYEDQFEDDFAPVEEAGNFRRTK